MKAFVLVSLKQPKEKEMQLLFKKYKQVKRCHLLFGEWDLLVELEVPTEGDLATFIIQKIRSQKEVKLTSTLIVARS